jgi:hypothetical protein
MIEWTKSKETGTTLSKDGRWSIYSVSRRRYRLIDHRDQPVCIGEASTQRALKDKAETALWYERARLAVR